MTDITIKYDHGQMLIHLDSFLSDGKIAKVSDAYKYLERGMRVARKGWNGKGIYLEMQFPDAHSKMTQPYVFIVTTGLKTDNENAPKGIVPWTPSQTDMAAKDWVFAE